MPYIKAGNFHDTHPMAADAKRQVAYIWEGPNRPFLYEFHLIQQHDGSFGIVCSLSADGANVNLSQAFLMSAQTALKAKGIESFVEKDTGSDSNAITTLSSITRSYEEFKEIFKILVESLPADKARLGISPPKEPRGRANRTPSENVVNRDRDRSPVKGYLAVQHAPIEGVNEVIKNISSELSEIDIDKITQELGNIHLSGGPKG